MTSKELGRISKAQCGYLGDFKHLAVELTFAGKSWGVGSYIGADNKDAIRKMLDDAGKRYMHEMVGVPVEITFEGNVIKDWRVLTEVL